MHQVDLTFDGTLESFFYEQLEQVRKEDGDQRLERDLEAYLVHILAKHARRPQVAGRTSPALATQFLAARECGQSALRDVGDRALYIAGVIPRSLDRSPVGVEYIAGIGAAAYSELHARSRRLDIFARLAERFRELVELLGRVVGVGESSDLLALYERWRKTSEPRDRRRLIAAGVLLEPATADILH